MSVIEVIHARQILDSRGNPTVEVDLRSLAGRLGGRQCPRAPRPGRTRRSSCATAAALRRQGRRAGGRPRQRRDRGGGPRPRRRRPGGPRPRADRARRDREQGAPRARTRSSACRWRSRARTPPTRGQPLWRYLGRRGGAPAAGADDERPQRRRARRQPGRLPGVHDRPGRRRLVRRGAADRRRGLPRSCKRTLSARGLRHGVGDEGGFAPGARLQRGAARAARRRRSRRPGTSPARTSRSPRPRQQRVLLRRRYRLDGEGRTLSRAEIVDYWEQLSGATRSSRSRTAWPRTTGTAGSS